MTLKKKVFGIICLLFQASALILGFFPCIFKVSRYVLEPNSVPSFVFDKSVMNFGIFFDPSKVQTDVYGMQMPKTGLWNLFAVLFVAFAVETVVMIIVGFAKKRISWLTVISSFLTFVFLMLTAVFVLMFSHERLTWQFNGKLQYGFIALLACQIFALFFLFFARGKAKSSRKKDLTPAPVENTALETSEKSAEKSTVVASESSSDNASAESSDSENNA